MFFVFVHTLFKKKYMLWKSRLQQTTVMIIFSLYFRENKIDISCESSARQKIYKKHHALFSCKNKSKENNKKIKNITVSTADFA